ncbi:hypothetical protein PS15p_202331 [Mucor circinelloides]
MEQEREIATCVVAEKEQKLCAKEQSKRFKKLVIARHKKEKFEGRLHLRRSLRRAKTTQINSSSDSLPAKNGANYIKCCHTFFELAPKPVRFMTVPNIRICQVASCQTGHLRTSSTDSTGTQRTFSQQNQWPLINRPSPATVLSNYYTTPNATNANTTAPLPAANTTQWTKIVKNTPAQSPAVSNKRRRDATIRSLQPPRPDNATVTSHHRKHPYCCST